MPYSAKNPFPTIAHPHRAPAPIWSAASCRRFGTGRHVSRSQSAVMPAHLHTTSAIPMPAPVSKIRDPFPISHPSSLHQGKKPSNRASSSLIKANDEKANYHHNERQRRGLIPAQGNALGTHRNIASSPERASHRANQGRKPQQSRPIVPHQGIRQKMKTPPAKPLR